jgi:flavin-dependent dehydrogenase
VSPSPTPETYDLPRQAIASTWDIGKLFGPKSVVTWRFARPAGVVFDFRRLKCLLMQNAQSLGAQVLLGTAVKGVCAGHPASALVTASGKECQARVVVDASGTAGVLAAQLGLRREIKTTASVGIELICRTAGATPERQRTVEFYFGSAYVPHGYAWTFPMGGDAVKVGVCVYHARNYRPLHLGALLAGFTRRISWLGEYEVLEKHSGIGYLRGGIRQHVRGNVLAIGDAADQINPLAGEGIRHALESARIARQVIEAALDRNDPAALQEYNALWSRYVGLRWRTCAWIARSLYSRFSDGVLEFCTRRMGKLEPEEAFRVAFDYAPMPLAWAMVRTRDRAQLGPAAQAPVTH